MTGYAAAMLPPEVRSRILPGINGLDLHLLEAGDPADPLVLLLHGFPELAWSWRRVLPALARAGYHAVAPDQRGYGRTTGWDPRYDGDLARTGFQGGLNWYRCRFDPGLVAEQQAFAGRSIDLPALFVAGAHDWGIHQSPGALTRMHTQTFTDMGPPVLVDGAGHWVQQEQPQAVAAALRTFLGRLGR